MSDSAARILERAAELVERGWAQRFFAYDSRGHKVEPTSGDAVEWCALGAIDRAAYELGYKLGAGGYTEEAEMALYRRDELTGMAISEWNDSGAQTADQVAATMRGAAASLREPAGAVA